MNLRMTPPMLAIAIAALGPLPFDAGAQSASQRLADYDKTTTSSAMEVMVDLYPAPDKYGKYGAPSRYPAQVLFERTGRFRISLRPGQKDEYRAVADAGIVRWLDLATGMQGKGTLGELLDPLAHAMLGAAGSLATVVPAKDLPSSKDAKVFGARLQTRQWGSATVEGYAWFASGDGRPTGFEFLLADGRKVFVAVLSYKQNPKIPPDAWKL